MDNRAGLRMRLISSYSQLIWIWVWAGTTTATTEQHMHNKYPCICSAQSRNLRNLDYCVPISRLCNTLLQSRDCVTIHEHNGLAEWERMSWLTEERWVLSALVKPWTGALQSPDCGKPSMQSRDWHAVSGFWECTPQSLDCAEHICSYSRNNWEGCTHHVKLRKWNTLIVHITWYFDLEPLLWYGGGWRKGVEWEPWSAEGEGLLAGLLTGLLDGLGVPLEPTESQTLN